MFTKLEELIKALKLLTAPKTPRIPQITPAGQKDPSKIAAQLMSGSIDKKKQSLPKLTALAMSDDKELAKDDVMTTGIDTPAEATAIAHGADIPLPNNSLKEVPNKLTTPSPIAKSKFSLEDWQPPKKYGMAKSGFDTEFGG